jgi:hypothetical protein
MKFARSGGRSVAALDEAQYPLNLNVKCRYSRAPATMQKPKRVLRPFALSSMRASAVSPTAGGRWLGAIVEAEKERRLGARFGAGHQLGLLFVVQWRELARKLHVLFELGNRIAPDNHGADRA